MQKAVIVKSLLEEEHINVVMIDKAGYPYQNLGEVELFVFWQQAERAIEIVFKATT